MNDACMVMSVEIAAEDVLSHAISWEMACGCEAMLIKIKAKTYIPIVIWTLCR